MNNEDKKNSKNEEEIKNESINNIVSSMGFMGNLGAIDFSGIPQRESLDSAVDLPPINFRGIPKAEGKNSAEDFLKDTPYSVNKGFTPSPMNTPNQFDATEISPSMKDEITFEGIPKPENTDKQILLHAEIDAITRHKIIENSTIDKSIVDFLKGSPYEVLKGFTPRPTPTPEQFDATEIKDTAVGNIAKIRGQSTEAPNVENKNKPK